jgi:hypothetical protein
MHLSDREQEELKRLINIFGNDPTKPVEVAA